MSACMGESLGARTYVYVHFPGPLDTYSYDIITRDPPSLHYKNKIRNKNKRI